MSLVLDSFKRDGKCKQLSPKGLWSLMKHNASQHYFWQCVLFRENAVIDSSRKRHCNIRHKLTERHYFMRSNLSTFVYTRFLINIVNMLIILSSQTTFWDFIRFLTLKNYTPVTKILARQNISSKLAANE